MSATAPSRLLVFAELAAISVAYLFLSDVLKTLPFDLPQMPVMKLSWVSFSTLILAIAWLRLRGADLSLYGLKPFRPPFGLIALAVAGCVAAVLTSALVEPVLAEAFGKADIDRLDGIRGNLGVYLYVLPFMWIFAAFGEELFYRGFLMFCISRLLGGGRWAWAVALVAQAVLFGIGHSYQGVSGMISTGLYGLIYGLAYLLAGRNLWAPILIHGGLNTFAFTLIYLGLM